MGAQLVVIIYFNKRAHLIARNLRKKFLQFETYARIIDSYGERTDIESSMQIFNAVEAALLIKLKA